METTDSQGVADEAELCPSSRALLEASSTELVLQILVETMRTPNGVYG